MEEALVRAIPENTAVTKFEPGLLMAARFLVQTKDDIRRVFVDAKEQGWSPALFLDALFGALQPYLNAPNEQIEEVSQYLIDEQVRLGDSLVLVSSETGQAFAQISEEDIYEPLVPRENGQMVKAQPRLRPQVEAALVQWTYENAREKTLVRETAKRLAVSEDDRRLLPLTRKGRATLTAQLKEQLVGLLPERCSGITREFFDFLKVGTEAPPGLESSPEFVGTSKSTTSIVDLKSLNLRHDFAAFFPAKIAAQWAREIAQSLASLAHEWASSKLTLNFESVVKDPPKGFWITSPDTIQGARRVGTSLHGLPIQETQTALLRGPVGTLVINPESFKCASREYLGRWEVVAEFRYTLYVDWSQVTAVQIEGVPLVGLVGKGTE